MRVLLVYYTGTYNTRYLSDKVEERFLGQGDTVDRIEITSKTPARDASGYDLIGFSYPIYGFNAPAPFLRYVKKKLKTRRGQRFFIYKNSGETFAMNNASSRTLLRLMKRRGCELLGEYHFVMPYNIHFPFEDDFVREILYYNRRLLDVMMKNLADGVVHTVRSKRLYDLGAFFVGIQKVGGNVNSFLYKVDAERCTGCMKCVRDCPHDNIYVKDGKIRFHHHCDMCMRCSFLCPTDAIKIGFLEGWHVNGAYRLSELERLGPPDTPYITQDSEGFYSCFIEHFAEIDRMHKELFGE